MHGLGEPFRHVAQSCVQDLDQELIDLRAFNPKLTKLRWPHQTNLGRPNSHDRCAASGLGQQSLLTHHIATVDHAETNGGPIYGERLDENSSAFQQIHAIGRIAFAAQNTVGVVTPLDCSLQNGFYQARMYILESLAPMHRTPSLMIVSHACYAVAVAPEAAPEHTNFCGRDCKSLEPPLIRFHEHFCHTIWLTSVQEVTPERVRWALALGNYGIVAHHWTGLR